MMARNWLSAAAILALGPGPKAAPGEGYCISATTAAIKSPCTHRNHERCLDVQTGRASRKFPRNLGLKITNKSSVGISWITSVCSVYSLRPVLSILSQRHHNTEFVHKHAFLFFVCKQTTLVWSVFHMVLPVSVERFQSQRLRTERHSFPYCSLPSGTLLLDLFREDMVLFGESPTSVCVNAMAFFIIMHLPSVPSFFFCLIVDARGAHHHQK